MLVTAYDFEVIVEYYLKYTSTSNLFSEDHHYLNQVVCLNILIQIFAGKSSITAATVNDESSENTI